jgi:hypothetical protein
MNEYYTYAYLREDGTPYYIGKGKKDRAFKKHKVETPPKNRILFLKKSLTEEEAFQHEKYMIAVFGRKDLGTGILENKNAGGNGSSGKIYSEEERERIRNEVLGRKWWNNGTENTQSKKCPGNGWILGRLITWNEEDRMKNILKSVRKKKYKLTHENGDVIITDSLREFCMKISNHCGCKLYKILKGEKKYYKGWISVEII